jgi:mono/diheme cytochrome c family protein
MLSTRYPTEALAESLAEGISVGSPDMPEFSFEHDEIAAILAYLKSVQGH